IYKKGVRLYSTLDYNIQKAADTTYQSNLESIRRRIKYRTARYMYMPHHLKTPLDTIVKYWDRYYPRFEKEFINSPEEKRRRKYEQKLRFPDSLHYREAQAAVIVIENKTGAVRALIGGKNFIASKFNRAIQAVRSPGSSFKPIVYTAAIDNGATPLDSINDQPITIPDPQDTSVVWRPKNYDGKFEGNMVLRRAFYRSKNLPAIKIAIQYGLKTIVSYARRFGLTHRIPAVPSVGIGSCDATLMEMTSAYTVFPNNGIRPEPYFIAFINDKEDRLIYRNIPKHHETIRPATAYIVTSILKDVNIRGTGASIGASGFKHSSGGKTGTTNSETDAWYIGFTRYYTTGVWVGTDDHKPLGRGHTGSADAIPTWLSIMKEIHKDLEPQHFAIPPNVIREKVCTISGDKAGNFCSHIAEDYFIDGTQPEQTCNGRHQIKQKDLNAGDAFNSKRKYIYTPVKNDKKSSKRVRNVF
ncbi:MAG: penicillin-binding protein, partial [Fibrobacteria bacterium]|nr:penicillin-binding protein [Fibrobacteria bacterium]